MIEGNRKYVRCLYVYNKIDTLSIEEVDELARKPDSVVISLYMKLNIDYMLQKVWDYLGLLRIYTKRRGQPPDLTVPVVLSDERHGLTVEAACKSISRELLGVFNFALVWGRSTKYNPQRVGLTHVLQDEDVLQVRRQSVLFSSSCCCVFGKILYIFVLRLYRNRFSSRSTLRTTLPRSRRITQLFRKRDGESTKLNRFLIFCHIHSSLPSSYYSCDMR